MTLSTLSYYLYEIKGTVVRSKTDWVSMCSSFLIN